MLPEIVIMKTEENQRPMENTCVKSGAVRFPPSTSASSESDFTIFVQPFIFYIFHLLTWYRWKEKEGEDPIDTFTWIIYYGE